MSIHHKSEFDKAKNESEPLFATMISQMPEGFFLKDVFQINDPTIDKKRHADHIGSEQGFDGNFYSVEIDVKQITEENMHTRNYSLTKKLVDYVKNHKIMSHRLAFRLSDRKHLLDKFLYVKSYDVISRCHLIDMKNYFLININDVMKLCDYKIIEFDF